MSSFFAAACILQQRMLWAAVLLAFGLVAHVSNQTPYSSVWPQGHEDSVEDIQWSPTEGNVLASCSVDRTIRIWDSRVREAPQLTVTAHAADVNVISWNALASHTLASGGDDGVLRVWDLRAFSADRAANEASFVANFAYHRQAAQLTLWHAARPKLVLWGVRSCFSMYELIKFLISSWCH